MRNVLAKPPVWIAITALIVTAWLASHASFDYLSNDAAQYVSTARNLVRGHGFTTSILYYEQQHAQGQPAPQTSWPPGFPAAVAVAMQTGLEAEPALLLIGALAFIGIAFSSYGAARMAGAGAAIAAVAAILWLLTAEAWLSVLRGLSESLFIFMTMLSALVLVRAADHRRPYFLLFCAGMLAGAAFYSRYAGVAFVPAGMAAAAIAGLRKSWRDALLRALIFAVPVCVAMVWGFLRNLRISGSLTGGPRVNRGGSLLEVIRALDWSVRRLITAAMQVPLAEFGVLLVFACGAVVLCAAAYVLLRERLGQFRRERILFSNWVAPSWIVLTGAYTAATLVLFAYIGLTTEPAVVTERYMLPVLPFVIVTIALFVDRIRRRSGGLNRAAVALTIAMSVSFVASQIYAGGDAVRALPKTADGVVIGGILRTDVGGQTIAELIRHQVPPGASLLEANGQLIGLHLDVPTIGLPSAYYSRTVWDETAVRNLMRQTGGAVLCVFPGLRADPVVKVNRVFIQQLIEGARPSWLQPLLQREDILLFRVRDFQPSRAAPVTQSSGEQ